MRLLVMAFDGDTKLESPVFTDISSVWQYSSDIGSKWYFYPFCFAVTDSGKTVIDVPDEVWDWMKGMRVRTIERRLAELAALPAAEGLDVDRYMYFVAEHFSD